MANSPHARYRFVPTDFRKRNARLARIIFIVFNLLFVLGSIASGYLFVARSSAALANTILLANNGTNPSTTAPPGESNLGTAIANVFNPNEPTPNASAGSTASNTPEPVLVGQNRINILLLGVDQRPDERGEPTRTDTMIVVTIDPVSKTAGMLSIPRDLWVPIPLDDRNPIQNKITTAHFYGDAYHFPGGGPALAMKTVQYNLGVRINYYAKVDFQAFRRIVDTLGGIDLYVPTTLIDNEYPTDDYKYQRVYIPAGCQHLNGDLALKYARSRHMDSDFGRMKRQQAVLMAIRDRALNLNVIPKLPQLALQFTNAIETDIPLTEILKLAQVGKDIDTSAVTMRTIDGDAIEGVITSGGADAMIPVRAKIQKIVNAVFDSRPTEREAAPSPVPTTISRSATPKPAPSLPTATATPVTCG